MRLLTTNLCTESSTTITASSSNVNFPASNLTNPLRSKRWRSTDVDSESIVFDFQTIEDVNSVVLLWPKEDSIKISSSATITVQANATNVWTSPSVSQVLTLNETYEVASHFFATNQSYRYWRVLIEDPTNPYGYVELGVVWIGGSLSIDNAENGFDFSLDDNSKVQSNEFGHQYVDEYPILASIQFNYTNMLYEEIQIIENAFRINGTKKPVIVVLDPLEAVFDKDHFLVYGKFRPVYTNKHIIYNLFNTSNLTVTELA